jgi:hypothetical protein
MLRAALAFSPEPARCRANGTAETRIMADTGFSAAAEGSVGVHARDAFGNAIFLGIFPTVEEALAAAVGQSYVELNVNTADTPGGMFTLPALEPLVFNAPASWMARLDMGPGLN